MKPSTKQMLYLSALAVLFLLPRPAAAQSADELAKQTQNPVASLISVPLQGNWDFGLGDRGATGTLLNFQPVMPFALNPSTNMILRVIVPTMSQPAPDGTRINGLGDVLVTAFVSPSKVGRVIWGVGPVVLLPVATNQSLGTEKFGLGPSAVVLAQPGKFTVGGLFNHIWSVSGPEDRRDVNQTYLQPFATYNMKGGLSVSVSMEATANWKAAHEWTAPLLFSVGKVTVLGKRPVSFSMGAGPVVTSPDGGAEWRFRFGMTLLYPR